VGVAETEEALRAEVSEVCRNYCLQVWNEVLNQAGVEASFALRRAESVYYPPAIRAPSFDSSKADTASKVAEISKDSSAKVPLFSDSPSKEVEQPRVVEKEADTTKGVMPPSPQLLLMTHSKRKRYLPRWRLFWQLSICLPKGTSRVRAQKLQKQHSLSLPRLQQKTKL